MFKNNQNESTDLLSDWFDQGLLGLPRFLNVLWCESGNHCVVDRPGLVEVLMESVGGVEEASALSWPARPCRSYTWGRRNS